MEKENEEEIVEDKEWEVIDKQRVVDRILKPGWFHDGMIYYRIEYILRNKKTGELKRV